MKINKLFFSSITKAILFLLTLTFISCGNQGGSDGYLPGDIVNNPNTAGTKQASDMPVIEFEKDVHDFGRVIQGEKVAYGFKFKNTGSSDLIISKVSSSCGCTVPDFPKVPIKPGESRKIDVKFDSQNRPGFQNKSVTIISNAQPSIQVLRIKAEVVLPENVR